MADSTISERAQRRQAPGKPGEHSREVAMVGALGLAGLGGWLLFRKPAVPTFKTGPNPPQPPSPSSPTQPLPISYQSGLVPNLPAYWAAAGPDGQKLAMAFALATGRWFGYEPGGSVQPGQPDPPTVQSALSSELGNVATYGLNAVYHAWAYAPEGELPAYVNAHITQAALTTAPYDVLFVTAAYVTLLGRQPSSADLAYWVPVWDLNQQQSTTGSQSIVADLLQSGEFQNRVAAHVTAANSGS